MAPWAAARRCEIGEAWQRAGVSDLRRRRGHRGGRRAVHPLRRLRVPGVPALRRQPGVPAVQDQVSGNQDQKHKIPERMLTWRMNSGASDDVGHAKYDSGEIGHPKYDSGEIPRGYIPSFTHSQISGEIPGASPDHMMAPVGNIGKRGHPFPYVNHSPNPSREFSGSLGNVAWKERVDGWKMKDKGAIPMTNGTSIAPSEGRGIGDIDASNEYNMEDASEFYCGEAGICRSGGR